MAKKKAERPCRPLMPWAWKREDFGKEIQQKVEDDMPNAWKVQQESMQKEKDDLGVIGVYNFKGQQKITAYKNGTFIATPIN